MRIRRLMPALLLLTASIAAADRVPNLTFKTLDGQNRKLESLRGRVTVLNLWATWCGPCQEELPRLSKLNDEYTPEKVDFIAVSIDDKKDLGKIQPLFSKLDVHLDVWTGGSADTLDRLKLGTIVPATIILDEQGEVVTRIEGEAREEDVKSALDWLLRGRTGAAPTPVIKRY